MDVIGANLVAKAARAAVDLNYNLTWKKSRLPAGSFIKKLVNHVDLDKVITGPKRPHLGTASLFGPVTDLPGVGTGDTAPLFGVFQVIFGGEASLQGPTRAGFD